MIDHNGEKGVFIPLAFNGRMKRSRKRGENDNMIVVLKGKKSKNSARDLHEYFHVIPPREHLDLLLSTKGLFSFDAAVGVSYLEDCPKGTVVTSSDFEDILKR